MDDRVRIKICCISSEDEAKLAIDAGADAIGLVGQMPGGPGIITDELIRQIAQMVSPPVATFLLTSETSASGIMAHHNRTHTNTIQIVDRPLQGTYAKLRSKLQDVKLVQVIHIMNQDSVKEALEISAEVDALLLDSGNPGLKIKELGGTGRIHDWNISREIVERSRVPVFLAGGLNPENVREAFETVMPFGIDVCSGVRTSGRLDPGKLAAFMAALK